MSESDSTPPARIDVGVAQRDLVGRVGDGLRGGRAGAVERVGRDAGQELREEAHLARHVGHAHRGHDLAEDDLVHLAPVELGADQQLARGVARQGRGGDVAEDGSALGERRAEAGHDGHPPPGPGVVHIVLTVTVRGRR